ncbi:hypothetical protein SAMN05443582_11621 [Phyllobacterium sp. OV277]|jgi:microcystin-dependent protein|nr:hypothetical protein SAMN05443582_11621 [Phyllobacterium sp. OV277]
MKEPAALPDRFASAADATSEGAECDKVWDNIPDRSHGNAALSITPEMVDQYRLHARVMRNAAIRTAITTATRSFIGLSGQQVRQTGKDKPHSQTRKQDGQ